MQSKHEILIQGPQKKKNPNNTGKTNKLLSTRLQKGTREPFERLKIGAAWKSELQQRGFYKIVKGPVCDA